LGERYETRRPIGTSAEQCSTPSRGEAEREFFMKPANLAVCVTVLLLAAQGCVRRSPKKEDLLLAKVGQEEIRASDFRAELERVDPTLRSKYLKDRLALLDKMVEGELLYQRAVERRLAESPEVRRRLARVEEDAAIKRLKELEIYSKVTVTEGEIKKRYRQEITRPEGSSLVKPALYLFSVAGEDVRTVVEKIERGIDDGLSFPEIASGNSLPYQSYEFDSAAFDDLDPEIRRRALGMTNRMGQAIKLGEVVLLLFRDVEPLFGRVIRDERGERRLRTLCYRRIRKAIRDGKREEALGNWLDSRRNSGTIRVKPGALEHMTQTDAIAAEVNGVSLTVEEVTIPLEGLSAEEREMRGTDKKKLLEDAIDRELLRQESFKRNLQESEMVKNELEMETRRLLIALVIEKEVTGVTPPARAESLRQLVAGLRKAAGVKIVAENVKKMYVPASKSIEEVFGGESI
jgi:hypothetical protein